MKYLAIDIGASSGRHIVGWWEAGAIRTQEVHRFYNGVDSVDGHLVWDIDRLEREVRSGIDIALAQFPDLVSLSIDTWGVDYVLLRGDEPVRPCYGKAVRELETVAGRTWERLYIAGGGAKNEYLNELTAKFTGKQVIALPIEATALGNLKIQMEALS